MARRSVYEYLKAVYALGGRPGGRYVSTAAVARSLGVAKATVAVIARRLEGRGLLEREPGRGLRLTGRGLEALARFAWKVGLLELALSRAGLRGAALRRIARKAACTIDDEDAEALCRALGHPRTCPHGHSIPHPCTGDVSLEGSCVLLW